MEIILELDKNLLVFLNNLGSPSWDGFWLVITHKLTFTPLYIFLLYLLYRKLGLKSFLILLVLVLFMVLFTDQVTNLFKAGFQRFRPCRDTAVADLLRRVTIDCNPSNYFCPGYCGKFGFFSGHASNSMATAIFVGLLLRPYYKNLIFVLVLWSLTVAYSRIYVGVHYPLDIFFGLLFGIFSGLLFKNIYNKLLKFFTTNNKPS